MNIRLDPMEELIALTQEINRYCDAYYKHDISLVTDREYDEKFDRLQELETQTGIIMANSPTQRPMGEPVEFLQKVTHTKPMLSAQKTKSIDELKAFIRAGNVAENQFPGQMTLGWKADGLTLVLRYENGILVQAITRGNGEVGEDVTHTARMYSNIPIKIPCKEYIEVRGEGVVSWDSFNQYNDGVADEEQFSAPRNMASGSTRLLDPMITKARNLSFLAFELVAPLVDTKQEEVRILKELGFYAIELYPVTEDTLEKTVKQLDPKNYPYPVDGLILEYEDKAFGRSLGSTGHHENCRIAYKWQDDLYTTRFRKVIMRTTRTGMVSLKAQFDPVMIDGSKVEYATLHNLTFFRNLNLGIGDEIQVYKANMIIPAIEKNLTQSGTYRLDMTCPCCGTPLQIHIGSQTGSETLHCPNDSCPAKMAAKFEHFVSKPAMNIVGLSSSKLEDLLDLGFVRSYADIYHLDRYQAQIEQLEGWGTRSFQKLQESIENSRRVKLAQVIPAFGIPMVGKHAGKEIHKYFKGDPEKFMKAVMDNFDFRSLPDFGDIMAENLRTFFQNPKNLKDWNDLIPELNFETEAVTESQLSMLTGKVVVATGSFHYFSRNGINRVIERFGGVAKGSVSKKTDFVVAGEKAGSKLTKATELGVTVLTEDEFLHMLGAKDDDKEKFADRN